MRTKPSNSGLLWSIPALVLATSLYGWIVWRQGVPTPQSRVGLAMGIAGLAMMLGAETLYTLRKRMRSLSTGRMSVWLQSHIFLGILGPAIVLLHSAGKYHGIAAIAALLTVVTVFSGFVGRFLYTSVPRTLDGGELGLEELASRFAEVDRRLASLDGELSGEVRRILEEAPSKPAWHLPLTRPWMAWRYRRHIRHRLSSVANMEPAVRDELAELLADRQEIQLEMQALAATRRLLSLWHLFHVPLGVILFTVVLVHVVAAVYFTPWRN